jgi:large subunit ribosomal protein L11
MTIIKLLVEGGKMTPGPAVAQQLGPIGINLTQLISDVNLKTKSFSGMNVPVILNVDSSTKKYTISVASPPASELLKKELGIEKGSGERLKVRVGNLAFERVIFVASQKHDNMLSNDFLGSLKSILGTCQALGILVDSKEIKDVFEDLKNGKYDAMIKAKKTDVDIERTKELKAYFSKIQSTQDAAKAAQQAEAEKKEETKVAAPTQKGVTTALTASKATTGAKATGAKATTVKATTGAKAKK